MSTLWKPVTLVKPIDFSMFSHVFPLFLVMFSSFQASPKMTSKSLLHIGQPSFSHHFNRPYIGLIYGRYLQFRFLEWPLIIVFFGHIFPILRWPQLDFSPKKSPPDANHAVGCASCWSTKPLWACRTKRGVAPKPPWLKFRKPGLSTDQNNIKQHKTTTVSAVLEGGGRMMKISIFKTSRYKQSLTKKRKKTNWPFFHLLIPLAIRGGCWDPRFCK